LLQISRKAALVEIEAGPPPNIPAALALAALSAPTAAQVGFVHWETPHVHPIDFFLDAGGRLAQSPGDAGADTYEYRPSVGLATGRRGLGSTTPWAMPIDQRLDDAYSRPYDTAPLTASMELLGEPGRRPNRLGLG
jgi:hypothetical protein